MELHRDDYLRQIMAIRGVLGTSLVDYQSGLVIGAAGRSPGDDRVTACGAGDVMHAALAGAAFADDGAADHLEDIVLTARNGYHLVYLVGRRPDGLLVLYVWLDRLRGNLAMAQRRIHSLTEGLVPA